MNLQETMNKLGLPYGMTYAIESVIDWQASLYDLCGKVFKNKWDTWQDEETFKDDYKYTKQITNIYWRILNKYYTLDMIQWTYEDTEDDAIKTMRKFCNNIVATHTKYVGLIATQEEALLKMTYSLESSSEQRFNDTPDSEGDYSAEKYTTNITKVTSQVAQNPLDVYEARKKALENLYTSWEEDILKGIIHYE